MTISIKDIAKYCNLDPSTVSRALNHQYGVNPNTRKRVLEAAKELGYVPSLAAKDLVNKSGSLIGIIIPESDAEAQPAFFTMLPYINKKLNAFGLDTITYAFNPYAYQNGELENLIRKRGLRGCIVLPGFMKRHKVYEDVKKLKKPIVVLEVSIQTETCSSLLTNDFNGAYIATQHLIDNGHTKVGFINGPPIAEICVERLNGYKRALLDAHLEVRNDYVIHSNFTGDGGGETVSILLERHPELTAIFFANDLMAMGAISKLAQHGYKIPEDLSVVGYDGLFVSQYYNPPLTTIRNDGIGIGLKISEMLLDLINGKPSTTERFNPELVAGKSVRNLNE